MTETARVKTSAGDMRDLDRRAVLASVEVVGRVSAADLDRPTPCADWTLADLLAHMTQQHDGFAAAAAGRGADPAAWAGPTSVSSAGPAADYAAAARRVIAAFAEPGVLERGFALPEIIPGFEFPAAQAISFHFIDYVVHGWDVARALGLRYDLDPDLVRAALPVAQVVPDGERRLRPGAAFAPGLALAPGAGGAPGAGADPGAGAGPMEQILSLLGRSPAWSARSAD